MAKKKEKKMLELTAAEALRVFNSLDSIQLRRRTFPKPTDSYAVAKAFLEMELALKPYNDARDNIIAKWAEEGEDGKPKMEKVGDSGRQKYSFPSEEDEDRCNRELERLGDEVTIQIEQLDLPAEKMPKEITPAEIQIIMVLSGMMKAEAVPEEKDPEPDEEED